MNRNSPFRRLGLHRCILAAFVTASTVWAAPCFLCRKPVLDTPISLAVGTLWTPNFPVSQEVYAISIQVERTLPPAVLNCMMGVKPFPWVEDHCGTLHVDTLLEADWIVWDGDRAVAHGSVSGVDSHATATRELLTRQIGDFKGERHKRYRLEVTFTKDGKPLSVTHPRLIVMMTRQTDI